ncbi:MAG: A/G-specific adenine glycosylase [Candidatus Bathyarchaeota archaeon]|nr:A/G-specific adenine glycosylase [Candidatus Bathyarchaeota archaeon]MDH5733550.1 A/G-specific adenine glycosylase [Candidatus Bathyarchaeota archaeon]
MDERDEQTECASTSRILSSKRIHIFQRKLLQWYAQHGRDLPWRHTSDPYHILVSEMMLHQTQVARVIKKYHEWLAFYPTLEALAAAPLEEVKQLWRPLGYNFRPERLHQIAKFVVKELDGKLPSRLDELISFRGIGRYTADAILSFAFHKDAPIVDTNVCRLITRFFGVRGDPVRTAVKGEIWQLAEAMVPTGKAYIFNQALIDFGALVCTSRVPACSSCFANEMCMWKRTRKEPMLV